MKKLIDVINDNIDELTATFDKYVALFNEEEDPDLKSFYVAKIGHVSHMIEVSKKYIQFEVENENI